ncbi:MAG: family 78 glycoside hydrolase catalytic domain [Verrucomicrobiota bacterium]
MKPISKVGVLLLFWLFAVSTFAATAMTVDHLRCEHLENPLGIDVGQPRLSWINHSDRRGEMQTAYRILVASTSETLGKDQGDLWDSGKVASDQSVLVSYAGKTLDSRMRCYWKVLTWDKDGKASAWSEPAQWTMGLLKPDDWQAKWIGKDEMSGLEPADWIWFPEADPTRNAPVGTRYFRRTITLPPDQNIISADCVVSADNEFSLTVNDRKAGGGNDWRTPAHVDLKSLLHAGENQLLGTAKNVGKAPSSAGLILHLKIRLADGTIVQAMTDGQWETSTNQQAWQSAKVLGQYGMKPWNRVASEPDQLPARYLRREFQAGKKVARATAYVCGLGIFDLYLNGQKISDDVMDPALSDFKKSDYYVTFDVTRQIRSGDNAIGVVLGNGRYLAPRKVGWGDNFGFPKLLLQLEIEFADGSITLVATDEKWKLTANGPIRANNEYDGEIYDAQMEMPGWNKTGFDDAQWEPANRVEPPGGKMQAQMLEPMRVTQVIHPVAMTNPSPGIYVVDMGQNFYGTTQLKINAPRGTRVEMVSAYSVKPDGMLKTADNRSARCTDVYICKGGGSETWSPRFKGQGFRHVQINGFPGQPTLDDFQGKVIHTDVEPVGSFCCSNELINRIHLAMHWGMRMFLRSAPLDPDRDERQPWMGDPAKDAESEAFNFNVAAFYTKWMDDVRRSQRTNSAIPDVSMYWLGGDGVEWASVFTIIPDWFVDFYNDPRVAQNNYAAIKKWVLAMRWHGLPDGTLGATSYGDWCDAATMAGKVDDKGSTPRELVSSAYQYHNYRIMERLAEKFGKPEDKAQFAGFAEKLKQAFNKRFLNPNTHVYQGNTQCGYVLALQFGLAPEDQRDAIVSNLVDNILFQNHGHLSVGLIGMQWLMQTLTDVGRPDVAWTIATQTNRPSWGYMMSKGATTIWERWDMDTRGPGMNSEALLILAGNLDAWFYQTLAGLNYDPQQPGFKHIVIHPNLLGDLNWVEAHFDSPYGRIVSDWKRRGEKLNLKVTIPANTTATIYVPAKSTDSVTESGKPAVRAEGVTAQHFANGYAALEVGAGKYQFDSTP